ncbi:MAG: hypothetical protein WC082_04965 [Victivallales bacterium]
MNSINVAKLFPNGTVIVAYKGKSLGGAGSMPQWKIEPMINENRYLRSRDGLLAKLAVSNLITLEFEAVNPENLERKRNLYLKNDFDFSPGGLSFVPLDPEKQVAYYFPRAELKNKSEIKENNSIRWKFEIFSDNSGVFMEEFKTGN